MTYSSLLKRVEALEQRSATGSTLPAEMAAAREFFADPLGFVRWAYPWGKPGSPLEDEEGPDDNQIAFLTDLAAEVQKRGFDGTTPVMPVQMAINSGHGTGKGALGSWVTNWVLSTRPYSRGTVTAGTYAQLETRTWAAIRWWTRLCKTSHWFHVQARGIYAKADPENWNVVPQTCRAENAQSFAGQHAKRSSCSTSLTRRVKSLMKSGRRLREA
jgi:hypothetical protein